MRNYQNEINWRKQKYIEIRAYIDKNLAEKLKQKLEKNQKSLASWITEKASEYLHTEEMKNT